MSEDVIDPHDLMDDSFDEKPFDLDQIYRDVEDAKFYSNTFYTDNGVEITACCADLNYVIETDKYHVYWYVTPTNTMIILDQTKPRAKLLFEFKKEFDMSFFATLKESGEPWEIEYSSAELVNKRIEQILNLKVFL